MNRSTIVLVLLVAGVHACQGAPSDAEPDALTCDDLLAAMAECSPELAETATCTQQTLDMFSDSDPESLTCDELSNPGDGAADWAFNGCDEGYHPCGWFCCDHMLTWVPSEEDFNFVELVQTFQSATDSCAVPTEWETDGCTSVQIVDDGRTTRPCTPDRIGPQEMAVEITHGRVALPFEGFLERFEPATWGVHLDHYLGGEVQILETDSQGRATQQVERMVLTALPCDIEIELFNMDMTKVEEIIYEDEKVTVYWRVMHSDNCSTLSDVGSVSFSRYGPNETLITFHSAHLLGRPSLLTPSGYDALSSELAKPALKNFFADHVDHYRELVTGS